MADAASDWIDAAWQAAVAHHAAGRVRDAAVLYKRIATAVPDHAPALHHLGVIAHGAGHHADAARLLGTAAALAPKWPDAHANLGLVLHAMGRHDAAADSHRRAIALSPLLPQAHNNLGNALQASGRVDDAIASYRRAIEIDAAYAAAHGNLGNALREAGRADEAVAAHARAVVLRPTDARGHHNHALSLAAAGRVDESAAAHRRAAMLDPTVADPAAFNAAVTEGQTLAAAGRPADAAAAYRRAAGLRPHAAAVWHNLSVTLIESGDPEAGLAAADRADALVPNDPATLNNRAGAAKAIGRIADAVAGYRRAVAADPGVGRTHSNLVYALTFDPASTGAAVLAEARRCGDQIVTSAAIRTTQAGSEVFRRPGSDADGPGSSEYLRGRRGGRNEVDERSRSPHRSSRPLRVGYVSPDFRDHVVGRNVLPLIRSHDRSAVEVFCYASVSRPDASTDRFRSAADQWRDIAPLDDAAAADLVRADGINVLVDLTLHLAGNRLGVFARRPAAVQVTFGGYPGTTGLAAIGYRLTDPYLDPPGADADYAEQSIRLPHSFWCYDADAMGVAGVRDPGPPPAVASGFLTFGCLNNFCKVNDGVLAAWRRVLDAVPRSRLLLLAPPGSARERVRAVLDNRVSFVPFQSRADYLATFADIDIALDTFPYNGHTTGLDGLWMGVPTVTFAGPTVVGRAGFSQLSNLGLAELCGADVDGLVDVAARLATDLPRLTAIRAGLRDRMRRSPICDAAGFVRDVEAAYRSM